jgi:hypothetical protein
MAVKNPTIRFNTLIEQLEDEHSLINCVPPEIKSKLLEIPEKYLNKSEEELLELFDSEPNCRFTPSATNDALRNNFWIEFDRAQSDRKSPVMIINNFIGGVVLSSHVQYITVEQWAYIICKPPTYEAVMAGMQSLATRRLRDILSLPLHTKDGSLNDPKHIELILRAAAMWICVTAVATSLGWRLKTSRRLTRGPQVCRMYLTLTTELIMLS